MRNRGGGTLNPEGGSGCGTGKSREVGGLSDSAHDGTLTLGDDTPRNDVVAQGDGRSCQLTACGAWKHSLGSAGEIYRWW